MSTQRKTTATVIREELQSIQIDHTLKIVEAIASVLLASARVCREEEAADPDAKPLPDCVNAAFARLQVAMLGEPG
jgi:hypothetical protein